MTTKQQLDAAHEAACLAQGREAAAIKRAEKAERERDELRAAGAAMRETITRLLEVLPHEAEGLRRASVALRAREILEVTDCGKALLDRLERYQKALADISHNNSSSTYAGKVAREALKEP